MKVWYHIECEMMYVTIGEMDDGRKCYEINGTSEY